MSNPKEIAIADYDYPLSDSHIAFYPKEERDSSKLLIYKNEIKENVFKNISEYLPKDSILIYNNSKVIAARLYFTSITGAIIEIFCLEPYLQSVEEAMRCTAQSKWICLIGNAKKFKLDKLILKDKELEISASKVQTMSDGKFIVNFEWNTKELFASVIDRIGNIPLPPYIKRKTEVKDAKTYQTVFSKIEGSVASSTSGLHFTAGVFEDLKKKNIETHAITLHIGAGTFVPVKANTIGEHTIHQEEIIVSKEFISLLKDNQKFITCVGTTSVRTVESIYWLGVKITEDKIQTEELIIPQWMPYDNAISISISDSLTAILNYLEKRNLDKIRFKSQIIIVPGYKFKFAGALITNFHQPKSSLLLLVSAFIGNAWKEIYNYALKNGFSFLSYGDSSLLFRNINC